MPNPSLFDKYSRTHYGSYSKLRHITLNAKALVASICNA